MLCNIERRTLYMEPTPYPLPQGKGVWRGAKRVAVKIIYILEKEKQISLHSPLSSKYSIYLKLKT